MAKPIYKPMTKPLANAVARQPVRPLAPLLALALMAIFFWLTLSPLAQANPQEANPQENVDATIVEFYADWCTSCKILDPQLELALATFTEAKIELVRLDFTKRDWDSVVAQAAIAKKYGIEEEVSLDHIKTGFALIVVDKEVRGRISAGMDAQMIQSSLRAALSQ